MTRQIKNLVVLLLSLLCLLATSISPAHGDEQMEQKRRAEVGLRDGDTLEKSNAALAEGLLPRLAQLHGLEPARRDSARRGLPLADLVAVDHEHVGTRPGQLASHRESGE